jgi:Cys-rich four helix bundle protein (predicted Tat secretion target)
MLERAAVFALAASTAGPVLAQAEMPAGHEHVTGRFAALVASAAHCSQAGAVCLAHCHVRLAEGETALAACASSVSQLLAACDAMVTLASLDSQYVPAFAAVLHTICVDCEAECRKHPQHPQCVACGDACAECAEQCQAVMT